MSNALNIREGQVHGVEYTEVELSVSHVVADRRGDDLLLVVTQDDGTHVRIRLNVNEGDTTALALVRNALNNA